MPDLLEHGAVWLEDQRTRHLSRMVRYARGPAVIELVATVGRTEFEQVDEKGIVHRLASRDYLVAAQDLAFGGVPTLPLAGDRIHETVGQQVLIHEVMAPGGEPPWRYSDPYRRTLRIHTKLVGQESRT